MRRLLTVLLFPSLLQALSFGLSVPVVLLIMKILVMVILEMKELFMSTDMVPVWVWL